MIFDTIYRTTGGSYYCRVISRKDGSIWDGSTGELASSPSWANSVIEMNETSAVGQYPIVIPDALPAGRYDIVVYNQAGGSPANTDVVDSGHVYKKGSIFGF